MQENTLRCEVCHAPESPDNPVEFRKINVGKWMSICRRCAELRESAGKMAEKGTFLSEHEPDKITNSGGRSFL
jgi:hypothetical protein